MIFNKSFLMRISFLVLFTASLYGAELNIKIPSLVELCCKAFVQGAKSCEDMPTYLKQLEPVHDENEFTTLITTPCNDGYTVLHHAAVKNPANVHMLLDIYRKKKKIFNKQRSNKDTPYPALQEFINIKNNIAITPLDRAVKYGKFDVANLLLQKGASLTTRRVIPHPQHQNRFFLSPLLTTAILAHNNASVKYLLNRGVSIADSNLIEGQYIQSMHAGNLQLHGWHIVRPEDHDLPYKEGMEIALCPHVIRPLSLIKHSFDTHNDVMQFFFKDHPYTSQEYNNIAQAFFYHTQNNPQEYNELLHQALQGSIQIGSLDTLQDVIKRDPHILNHHPYILIDAIRRKYDHASDIAALLIDNGAIVNITDAYGNTPLHYAAALESALVIRKLVRKNANINAVNRNGDTPLDVLTHFRERTPERTVIRRYLLTHHALTGSKVRRQALR